MALLLHLASERDESALRVQGGSSAPLPGKAADAEPGAIITGNAKLGEVGWGRGTREGAERN